MKDTKKSYNELRLNLEEEKMALKKFAELYNIDVEDVVKDMKKRELQEIVAKHQRQCPITQGKDGRWRTYVKREDGSRKQIAKATEEKLHEALYEHYRNAGVPTAHTLEELFPQWIQYKEMHGAAKSYILRLTKDFKNHYSAVANIPIDKLTKLKLEEWACDVARKSNRSKKQYNDVTTIMRQMLDWVVDAELLHANVFRQVKLNNKVFFDDERKKPSETQVFTQREVLQICDYAMRDFLKGRNTKHKLAPLAIIFMFFTGLRVGEICAVRYEDIEGKLLNVQRMYSYETKEVLTRTKGYRQVRKVPLVSDAMDMIAEAKNYQTENELRTDGYIFSVNDEPLSYYSIKKLLMSYCDELGTVNKSSHKIRKTFISTAFESGIKISRISDVVGHNDTRTTFKHYCHDCEEQDTLVEQFEKALYKKNK